MNVEINRNPIARDEGADKTLHPFIEPVRDVVARALDEALKDGPDVEVSAQVVVYHNRLAIDIKGHDIAYLSASRQGYAPRRDKLVIQSGRTYGRTTRSYRFDPKLTPKAVERIEEIVSDHISSMQFELERQRRLVDAREPFLAWQPSEGVRRPLKDLNEETGALLRAMMEGPQGASKELGLDSRSRIEPFIPHGKAESFLYQLGQDAFAVELLDGGSIVAISMRIREVTYQGKTYEVIEQSWGGQDRHHLQRMGLHGEVPVVERLDKLPKLAKLVHLQRSIERDLASVKKQISELL